jgi:hypothetical protein
MQMTSTIDPRRIPVITLRPDEIEEANAQIAVGILPPNFWELHKEAVARNVFGHDAVKDRQGYREQGIGARGFETANHFEAIRKNEQRGLELPGTYDRMVAELWKRDPERAKKIGLQPPAR